jgi:hypothetical protein
VKGRVGDCEVLSWLQSKVADEVEGSWSLVGGGAKPGHAFRWGSELR